MHRPVRALIVVLLVLLATGTLWAQAAAPVLTILSSDGRRTLPVTVINNQDYVLVDELAGPFGTTTREAAGGLTIAVHGRTIILTADQTVVSVAGRLASLPAPALKRDDRWYVPVDFLPRALAPVLDTRLDLRRASRLVVTGDLNVPRIVTRVETGTSSASVTFEITPVTPVRITAEAGRLAPIISQHVKLRTMMLGFEQHSRRATGIGGCAACIGLAIGCGKFGAQFGVRGRTIADVGADEVGLVGIGFVVDRSRCNLQLLVGRLPFDTAASVVDTLANAIDFILRDDELRIEATGA